MLLECIGNTPGQLLTQRAKNAYKREIHQDEVYLEIGKRYICYGVVFRSGEDLPWFLVCEDDDYPTPHLGEFFKIVAGEISEGWEFTTSLVNVGKTGILPIQWANDPAFMEKLINEDKDALDYFAKLKADMEKRFSPTL